ncbi:unnamed protein product [Rhodiola kirilowii]
MMNREIIPDQDLSQASRKRRCDEDDRRERAQAEGSANEI